MSTLVTPKNEWTTALVDKLMKIVRGEKTWEEVAAAFRPHNGPSCRQRFFSTLAKVHGRWSDLEMRWLLFAMFLTRTRRQPWLLVSDIVETRSYRQCIYKWRQLYAKGLATFARGPPADPTTEQQEAITRARMTTTDDLEMRRGLAAQLTGLNMHTAHEWSMTFTDEGNDPLWREIMALDTIEADDLQSASTPHLSMSAITIHEPSSAETSRSVPSVAPGVASPRMAVPCSGDFSHWFHREITLRMQSRGPSTLNEQHGQDNNSTQTGLLHAH